MKKLLLLLPILLIVSIPKIDATTLKKIKINQSEKELNLKNFYSNSRVIRILPNKDEISRWEVTIKKTDQTTDEKTINEKIIKELSQSIEFIEWWDSYLKGIPVQKSLAIIYSYKTDFLGRIRAEISFLPFLKQAQGVQAYGGGPAAEVLFDVKAAEPIISVPIKFSDVDLMVWSYKDLDKLKINKSPNFIRARYSNGINTGRNIPFDMVNPPFMYNN